MLSGGVFYLVLCTWCIQFALSNVQTEQESEIELTHEFSVTDNSQNTLFNKIPCVLFFALLILFGFLCTMGVCEFMRIYRIIHGVHTVTVGESTFSKVFCRFSMHFFYIELESPFI